MSLLMRARSFFLVKPIYYALDLFGASRSVTRAWRKAGFAATAFDIKLSKRHDLCTKMGFFLLGRLGMQLLGTQDFILYHFI